MAINDQLKKLYHTITGKTAEGMAIDEILAELNADYPAGGGGSGGGGDIVIVHAELGEPTGDSTFQVTLTDSSIDEIVSMHEAGKAVELHLDIASLVPTDGEFSTAEIYFALSMPLAEVFTVEDEYNGATVSAKTVFFCGVQPWDMLAEADNPTVTYARFTTAPEDGQQVIHSEAGVVSLGGGGSGDTIYVSGEYNPANEQHELEYVSATFADVAETVQKLGCKVCIRMQWADHSDPSDPKNYEIRVPMDSWIRGYPNPGDDLTFVEFSGSTIYQNLDGNNNVELILLKWDRATDKITYQIQELAFNPPA